ncbi:unnamed protein product [Clavelina lepadiformis]|uniref:Uncharacterized protein n=1 Tax=Clavelina lepadiformis TaxID=159417 RepID=A0ABP0GYD2_CLALP
MNLVEERLVVHSEYDKVRTISGLYAGQTTLQILALHESIIQLVPNSGMEGMIEFLCGKNTWVFTSRNQGFSGQRQR